MQGKYLDELNVGEEYITPSRTLTETDVTHHPRVHGTSKYGLHNRLWRGLYDLFGVAWLRRRYVAWEVEGERHGPTDG